ncbi:MAG TPA: collagen-binding domain-containing protein [Sedimentisphaerales bacterium]|nr:collagen-binding domain-containing protein [Sedimentisphaerales bacterium]
MSLKKRLQSKRRGDALSLAVIAVMLLLAMGMGLLSLGLRARLYSTRVASAIAARCAADAGLTMALFEMNQKLKAKPWSDSILPAQTNQQLSNCDAGFSFKVLSGSDGYVIESVGTSGLSEKRVYATLQLQGLFEHAILTRETLVLKSGTVVDGYNSLDPLDTDADVDIGTQSTADASITLNNGVTVKGDVVVGIGGDPDTVIKDLGAATGDQYAATQNDPLPLIIPPALPNKATAISAKGEIVTLTPADSGRYTGIDLKNASVPGVLEISGGQVVLHITSDIKLGQSCEIIVRDGASLTIYADGDVQCANGSNINTENPPEAASTFQLYATGDDQQSFDLKAKSEFTGIIYAPNADVQLYAGGDAYGSIVANTFEFKSGGNYHYDEALRKVEADDEGVRFVVKRWYEGSPE